jgi:hypothetical protein
MADDPDLQLYGHKRAFTDVVNKNNLRADWETGGGLGGDFRRKICYDETGDI